MQVKWEQLAIVCAIRPLLSVLLVLAGLTDWQSTQTWPPQNAYFGSKVAPAPVDYITGH